MTLGLATIAIFVIAATAWWFGFARARRLRAAGAMHSLPSYHGAYAALWRSWHGSDLNVA